MKKKKTFEPPTRATNKYNMTESRNRNLRNVTFVVLDFGNALPKHCNKDQRQTQRQRDREREREYMRQTTTNNNQEMKRTFAVSSNFGLAL